MAEYFTRMEKRVPSVFADLQFPAVPLSTINGEMQGIVESSGRATYGL